MCQECGCADTSHHKVVEIQRKVLEDNDTRAHHNRDTLNRHNVLGINLMSSPGSGKTTLLEKTIECITGDFRLGVIEGDLETEKDAERIRNKGIPVHQITTGQTCHLDASMIHDAMHLLPLHDLDMLFIENVGNLVCPAAYALGTHINVVLLSTTEGDDKPAKYPIVFRTSDVLLITKVDQLLYTDFNVERALQEARVINPSLEVMQISSKTGEGFDDWLTFLKRNKRALSS
jgi:hydrogenase nickel incorporation protein HypB